MASTCVLCERTVSSGNNRGDPVAISMCGDCEFLIQENIRGPVHEVRRRPRRVRRRDYRSPESIENIFSQQFSSIINMARQTQHAVSEHETSRTTPSGSSRWRRVLSDTESDGFESINGESDSNVSFSAYRVFHGESDTVSFSAYGGDSDASVDAYTVMDNDIFVNPHIDTDTDTDIDPMHAGVNFDDQDEQDEDNDSDVENIVELQRSIIATEIDVPRSRQRFEGTIRLGIRERRRRTRIPSLFADLAESELGTHAGNVGDYLDARGFEELLEHLAEVDNSRRGAPPASISFVNSLPRVTINEEHCNKQESLACAICKEFLCVGTITNQLPCFHLYHPTCILPWLSTRNSCPLCRYELPTDDKEYEESKRRSNEQQAANRESSSETSDADEEEEEEEEEEDDEACEFREVVEENGRGRWFYLAAAAPIVSLVGIVVAMWLGNPRNSELHMLGQSSGLCPPNRRDNRTRRWWSLF